MKSSKYFILVLIFLGLPLFARDVDQDMKRIEMTMRGNRNVYYQVTMTVYRERWDRVMSMNAWDSKELKASFVKITAPPRDAGTAFLKKDKIFRQYIPRIKRTIRISPSMMLQSWMGSDFSNDDLARESSLSDDYIATFVKEEKCDAAVKCNYYTLNAKPNVPVVWPSMKIVTTTDFVPVRFIYINSEGKPLKEMDFSEIKNVNGHLFPFLWIMKNLSDETQKTELKFHRVIFDGKMPLSIFTDRNLRRGK